jgi:hypothetical protein
VFFLGPGPPPPNEKSIKERTAEFKNNGGDEQIADALHELRKFGNHTDHDETDDLKSSGIPKIIAAAFKVATRIVTIMNRNRGQPVGPRGMTPTGQRGAPQQTGRRSLQ